jgi:hypothetical protein
MSTVYDIADIVSQLETALKEATSYDPNDNIQPSMRTTVDGDKLASCVRVICAGLQRKLPARTRTE